MRILGIDPGTWRMGVGVIDTQGNRYQMVHAEVIRAQSRTAIHHRVRKIYAALVEIIKKYRPEILVMESVFYAKDLFAMVRLGEARACAMLAAGEQNLEMVEYTPATIKKSVAGSGRATKEQVQRMVKTLLSLQELPQEDSADALAIAICHVHAGGARNLIQSLKLKTGKNDWKSRIVLAKR